MDETIASQLVQLNRDFYLSNAKSFSATRRGPWPGWRRALGRFEGGRVLDFACGNMRFGRWLLELLPDAVECVESVDFANWSGMHGKRLPFHAFDFFGNGAFPEIQACDYSASWAFLHHVPLQSQRERLIDLLLGNTRSGGFAAVSLWRFMEDERIAASACATIAGGCTELGIDASRLDRGDFLLGWQSRPGTYRYCHSFDDAEIDALVEYASGRARLVDRYRADGKSGELDEYLVWELL